MEGSEEIKFSSMMPDKLDIAKHKAEDFVEWEKQWKDYYQLSVLDQQVSLQQLLSKLKILTKSLLLK